MKQSLRVMSWGFTVSASALFMAAPIVFAGGFQLWEENVTGISTVHAGDAASSENAALQFYNPATMTDFDHLAISVGGVGILLNTQVEPGAAVQEAPLPVQSVTEAVSGSTQNLVPNFSVIFPVSDKWAIGFSESSPFGLSTNYETGVPSPSHDVVEEYATDTRIQTINLNPNIAYALSPKWSIGVGFDAMYATADYDSTQLTNSLDDWGYGYDLGIYYKPSETWHFGLSYRSKIDLTLTGDSTDILQTTQASADLPMPATTYLSAIQKLSNKWNMLYSVFYTQWDVIDSLILENSAMGDVVVPQDYSNTWFFSLGSTYQLTDRWMLRGGVGYDQTPTQDGERDARLPDTDRYLLGVGATLKPNQRLSIDMGYQHIFMQDADLDANVSFPEHPRIGLMMSGVSSGAADLVALQVSYQFS